MKIKIKNQYGEIYETSVTEEELKKAIETGKIRKIKEVKK